MNGTPDSPLISASQPTRVRHLVLASLLLITAFNYLQRNSLGGAETVVRADLDLSRTDTGAAIGAFFFTYALFQVPSGWLAQRWGGRRTLAVYAAGWSLMTALSAAATTLPELLGARWAMGALQAGIFPCCTLILSAWYPATQRGFCSAMLNSFMLIGGAIASLVTGNLIGPIGWRGLFLLYSVPGLVWAFWFAWWFRDRPRDHPRVNSEELALIGAAAKAASAAPIPWLRILFHSSLWLICLQQFFRAGALRFFDQWLPTYLQEVRGQSIESANYWTSLPMLAGVFGGPLGGILSDAILRRTGSRRLARNGVAIGGLLGGLSCYVLSYFIADVRGAVLMASLGVCIYTFSSPCAYALSMDMGGRNIGIIFGAMNMVGNLGSWAFSAFLPHVVLWRGWDAALLVFAGMHVAAVLLWLPINPNGIIGEPTETASAKKE